MFMNNDTIAVYLTQVAISSKSQQEMLERDRETIRIYFPKDKIGLFIHTVPTTQ